MTTFHTKRGKNLSITGKAEESILDIALPKTVGVQPPDFKGLKPRVAVKVGDEVKVGTPVLTDKAIEGLQVVSPASGKVVAVNRGDKRALINIKIDTDGIQEKIQFESHSADQISALKQADIKALLLKGGLWPAIRQRPFSKIAHPEDTPKSIFVHAMNTEPLAADIDFVLKGHESEFQIGLNVLTKLTEGDVNLCVADTAKSKTLTDAQNVKIYNFSGAHPTGNVSTHIQYVDPIKKGDIVWYVEAWDVVRIARLLLEGSFPTEKVIAVTGEASAKRYYARVNEGAPVADLFQKNDLSKVRCLTGSVLTGRSVGSDGFVGFYDTQITAIPEGGDRELLGWLKPGGNKYTISRTFLSATAPDKAYSLNTSKNGGHRAIVLNHIYDEMITLDIMTFFLLKAIMANDIEQAEKLGILECDEEDFALASFACPSKTDVGGIIRQGLDIIEKEG